LGDRDVDGKCGADVGEEKYVQNFGGETEGKEHLENIGVDEMMILKWILKKEVGVAWTKLIWLRLKKTNAVVNTVMNFWVS
jgi:hypothetical protein